MSPRSATADVTADLILSLRAWQTQSLKTARLDNARLLADLELQPTARFHLDVDRVAPYGTDLYEAFGEWGRGGQRLRLGQFQAPFGIYNRSELYYVGLINDPLIHYYPFEGSSTGQPQTGLGYLGARGPWQLELALFGHGGGLKGLVPSEGDGSVRVQRFAGPLIVGLNALRIDAHYEGISVGTARFYGLDFRFSRPTLILRGELVTGRVAGASPEGFYVDALYHPQALPHLTFVGRTEAVHGQPMFGRLYRRHTIGVKWEPIRDWALALNQVFESPRSPAAMQGTLLFLWYTRRLH